MGHHPASTAQARAPKRHLHSARSPKGPVHAGSLRSTVLNWEDLVLKQCIPILSLRGVHTITSLDAVQADPGPCPTTQLLSLLLPYHGFLHPPSVPSPPVQASCTNATPFQWSILFHWKTFGNLLLVLYSADYLTIIRYPIFLGHPSQICSLVVECSDWEFTDKEVSPPSKATVFFQLL